ncbi:mediator of RNA polymerase II transcription subunit 20 isoform X1 [Aricia agestis]|uniref:mediator of RNA polymerase II transcription subunit 20 isoform X1 n=1 Tax=Aricia agestis TaxID=91739 RepID=UPI001C204F44|nr:mediator of RNA polymerase II transcription subunit 20 isoform X1 [Aricia agestis]
MGVTVLQQYPVPENKTGTYVIELLTKRILALGATQQGQFLVDCESYLSHPQMGLNVYPSGTTKTVHILHNSEQPASVFSILESGTKNIHVIADGLFDLLMMKLSQHYTSKKQTKIESKGPKFELGDFCVKLGSVTMNQNFKGVLIEVEYRPCVMANAVWGLLREFLQGLLGPSIPIQPPQHLLSRMNEIYTPIDTIYQYLEHFSAYRKTTGLRSA